MLQRLDKIAPYALLLVLGYLTYTSAVQGRPGVSRTSRIPEITARMLAPELVQAGSHASRTDRDPFEVEWASYLKRAGSGQAASKPAATQASRPASQASNPPAPPPVEVPLPVLPERLSGVFVGQGARIAVIGLQIYKVGSTIGGDDVRRCWRIEEIGENHVVLRFGEVRHILRITSSAADPGAPGSPPQVKGGQRARP